MDVYDAILDPKRYQGGLVVDSGAPLMHKDVSIYGVFTPGVDVPSSGLCMWNVYRGYNSVTLAGFFFPQATTTIFFAEQTALQLIESAVYQPIPLSTQLTISPALEQTISMGRLPTGMIKLYSATTSTTVAALNGQLAGGSVTDLRNLSDWSPPDLCQNSCTTKDAVANLKASQGIVAILGCDIRDNLRAINTNYANTYNTAARIVVDVGNGTIPITNQPGGLWLAGSMAISPAFQASVPGVKNFQMPFIPWGTGLRVRPNFANPNTGVPAAFQASGVVALVYGTIDALGNPTVVKIIRSPFNAAGISGYLADWQCETATFDTAQFGGPQALSLFGIQIYLTASTGINGFWRSVDIEVLDAYDLDTIGNHRILRWDNITANQTLNISGLFQVDGVPTGSIAPYVKSSANVGMGDPAFLYKLRALFASPETALRRIYSWADYEISKGTHGNEHALVTNAAQAAGMYASGMFGSSHPQAGGIFSTLGNMAGSAIDDAIGLGEHVFAAGGPPKRRRINF